MPSFTVGQKYMTCVWACFLNVQTRCIPSLFETRTVAAVCIYAAHFSFPSVHAAVIKANHSTIPTLVSLYTPSDSTRKKLVSYGLPTLAVGAALGYWWCKSSY
jgi:hypothetical protein